MTRTIATGLIVVFLVLGSRAASASGHGPVFAAATPTLGRGGWSLDQTWTIRAVSDEDDDQQMLRTMLSFGITENVQISTSVPLVMQDGGVGSARMMSMMSNDRDIETLVGYRFQRRALASKQAPQPGTHPARTTCGLAEAFSTSWNAEATASVSRGSSRWCTGTDRHHSGRRGCPTFASSSKRRPKIDRQCG
jgi:hypothetical protein